MAFTAVDEYRIQQLEEATAKLTRLVKGAGSTNQLNRLHVLAIDEYEKLDRDMTELEEKIDELLVNTRKLQ